MEEEIKELGIEPAIEKVVEERHLTLVRQSKLVPVDEINKYELHIFGVGSVGSHVTNIAAKAGFKNITVYDMDTVDEENISPQAFTFKHIGMNKTDAIKEIVLESAGLQIDARHGEITEETQFDLDPSAIIMCFFDSFEARKLLFEKFKGMPYMFVDARIGKFDMRHYLIDCMNEEQVTPYAAGLEGDAVMELGCGLKAAITSNLIVSSKIVMNILAYIKKIKYLIIYIGNAEYTETEVKKYSE